MDQPVFGQAAGSHRRLIGHLGRNTDFRRGVVGIFSWRRRHVGPAGKKATHWLGGGYAQVFGISGYVQRVSVLSDCESDYAKGLTMSDLSLRRLTSIERGRVAYER